MGRRYQGLEDRMFMVRVPMICTYSDVEIEHLGVPIDHGYNEVGQFVENTRAYNNLTTCMLPLSRLIEIHSSGYPIHLVNREDNSVIYNILEEYLGKLITIKDSALLNMGKVEEGLLESIEKFVDEMFGLNKGDIVRNMINTADTGSYNIGLDIMKPTPLNPYAATEVTSSSIKSRPANHISYPISVDDLRKDAENEVRRSKVQVGADVSYVYETVPEFNIDKVTRKPSYRKRYN